MLQDIFPFKQKSKSSIKQNTIKNVTTHQDYKTVSN